MDVQQEIKEFVSTNENNGALLLTGAWGCGKTYLIRKMEENLNEGADFLIVVVSLFGIDSVETLERKIKENVLYAQTNNNHASVGPRAMKKVKNFVGPLASALGDYSKVAKGINAAFSINFYDFVSVQKEIICLKENEPQKKQLVLVFDDFERCKINTIDLLGAINDYSENRGIKTILVADENKIDNAEYSDFKEKLISRTIKLLPDYSDIINSIIEGYNETQLGYHNFLTRNSDAIFQVFAESESENFRSLKAYLVDFERVFAAWEKSGVSEEHINSVFYIFGAMTFGVKSGNYSAGKYGFLFADTDMKKRYSNWQGAHVMLSIRKWIVDGIWTEAEFIDELKAKYRSDDMSDDEKFLSCTFWDLEQQYITKGMPIAIDRAYHGELARDELVDLLQKISALKKYEIPIPCAVDYAQIADGFRQRKEKLFLEKLLNLSAADLVEKEAIEADAQELYSQIKRLDDELTLLNNRKIFEKYLCHDQSIQPHSLKGLPIGGFDLELADLFLAEYYRAENYWRRQTIQVLLNLGHTDNIFITHEDQEVTAQGMIYLKKRIEEHSTILSDYISIAINKNFVKHLIELIDKLSEE